MNYEQYLSELSAVKSREGEFANIEFLDDAQKFKIKVYLSTTEKILKDNEYFWQGGQIDVGSIQQCNAYLTNILNNAASQPSIQDYWNNFDAHYNGLIAHFTNFRAWKASKTGANLELSNLKRSAASTQEKFTALESNIEAAQSAIEYVENLTGAKTLPAYASVYEEDEKVNDKEVRKWQRFLVVSYIALGALIVMAFFVSLADVPVIESHLSSDVRTKYDAGFLAFKAILIFIAYQLVRYFSRNLFAHKHIAYMSGHRKNILNSLQAIHSSVQNQDLKDKILAMGAASAFSAGESGFLTTREGAGEDESILNNVLGVIQK